MGAGSGPCWKDESLQGATRPRALVPEWRSSPSGSPSESHTVPSGRAPSPMPTPGVPTGPPTGQGFPSQGLGFCCDPAKTAFSFFPVRNNRLLITRADAMGSISPVSSHGSPLSLGMGPVLQVRGSRRLDHSFTHCTPVHIWNANARPVLSEPHSS